MVVISRASFQLPSLSIPSRLPILSSFLSLDLKLGVNIISLFGVLNKVAGVYGILAVFTGGAEWFQLSMYVYSIATLALCVWGIKKINEENGPKVLYYAHGFLLDHLVSTIYTVLFFVNWYYYVPHDGRRVANSDAQKEMMGEGAGHRDEAAVEAAAQLVWKGERGFSAFVIVVGWFIKLFFIFALYSYAIHLRRGTYHSLSRTTSAPPSSPYTTSHTRHSSTGGARYSHLRGASVATIDDGTASTMAESLWEEDDDFDPRLGELKSPAEAKASGMMRSNSGGVSQRDAVPVPDSPFSGMPGGSSSQYGSSGAAHRLDKHQWKTLFNGSQ
ncbi:hypothetical protein MNV49_004769 [Pseudohyphozyma bogoriensis]|nr:hypothetical protein MNV49_004769 [Pseudohyphozyma bogoriensis]